MAKASDLTGMTFTRLTVLKSAGKDKNRNAIWQVKCTCGNKRIVKATALLTKRTRSCGCLNHEETSARNSIKKWKGYEEINGTYWTRLGKGAKERGLEFNVTIEDGWKQFVAQNKKCALTGLDLKFARNYSKNSRLEQTASLDRVNSDLHYDISNIQWLHKDINISKWNLSQKAFIDLCDRVTYYQEHKKSKYQMVEEIKPTKLKSGYYLDSLPKIDTPPKGIPYDIIGKRFGRYIVLERVETNERISSWLCLCDCGNKKVIRGRALITGTISSCGCYRNELDRSFKTNWNGYEEISGSYWSGIKRKAKKRNRKFDISIQQAWNQFLKQDKCCVLTGERLFFVDDYGRHSTKQNASLDRINSSMGYVDGNIQWLSKNINIIKLDFEQDYFIEMCKMVSNHNKKPTVK